MNSTLLSAEQLKTLMDQEPGLRIFDCRFDLGSTEAGLYAWEKGHIPGAFYAHLDRDLSAAKNGKNGRHPLPDPESWKTRREHWGLESDTPVLCYDNQGGIFAARLWWMLKSTGHNRVWVLDGGFSAWKEAGGAVSQEAPPPPKPTQLQATPYRGLIIREEVLENLKNQQFTLLDARAPDRFAGQNETLDPVGGHIPGAQNRFFKGNLQENGKFKPAEELRQGFAALPQPDKLVHQCGSGVTACHNLLAMEQAGLTGSRLYAGSWSEWCCQEGYPVSTG
jgi:thiosulfate/3-mercaptopyruvate sulfurtransferase